MSEKQPPAPTTQTLRFRDIGFVSLFLFALALCGFLTVLANLTGIAERTFYLFPSVGDLRGLMTTTLVLALAGGLPVIVNLIRPRADPRRSRRNP